MATTTACAISLLDEAAAIVEAEWIRLQQDEALWERELADLAADLPAPTPRTVEPPARGRPTRPDNAANRSARQTLLTAITRRITQLRLTAAQAAAVLHLTGPRVTQLRQANVDEFTLDELVNLLPALQLTIQVVPTPAHDIGQS